MDLRDWGSRDPDSGTGRSRSGGLAGATTLTPFIPQFEWSPESPDFPLPFPGGAERAAVAAHAAGDVRPGASLEEVFSTTPSWMKLAPVALLLFAVTAFAAWQLLGTDDNSPPATSTVGTSALSTTETNGSATQRPGAGGAEASPTGGSAVAGSTSQATADSTATNGEGEVGEGETGTGSSAPGTDGTQAPIVAQTVDDGESLADVARTWGLNVSTLVWANPDIDDPTAPLEGGTSISVPVVDGVTYTVQDGDTLESIAAQFDVDTSAITGVIQNGVASSADLQPGSTITIYNARPVSRPTVAHYTVAKGDDLWKIASFYGLNPVTIAVANDLPDDYLIYPDQVLVIPPADGILYTVQAGESVETIAAAYNVAADVIINFPFNNLSAGQTLQVGQQILIPTVDLSNAAGGKGGVDVGPAQDPFAETAQATGAAEATGTFMWPVTGTVTTEFGGGHNGLDIANVAWTPIVAADGGVVTFSGWNEFGLGYAVAIDHENGYVTWYGHMVEPPAVKAGDRVSQGQWLGSMGSTGKSTGPHLHFVVLHNSIYENPLQYLP
ncbi:MAG: LysM peptidoglycan-binding domain-containing protein [Thermomicrobiales bacterium]|nr:LysM peptidoglycan-binding domain-containing protein [Thermomicrobiales bacterium]